MGRDTCQRNKRASPPTSETPVWKSCPPSSSLRRDDPGGKIESIFPGSTVVKALCYPCRGRGFDPWSGNKIPHGQKKKKMREREGPGRLWSAEGSPVYWPHLLYHVELSRLSHVQLFVTPWTVAHQAPLTMGFSRQEYWSRLPFPSPGNLPDPEIESLPLVPPLSQEKSNPGPPHPPGEL